MKKILPVLLLVCLHCGIYAQSITINPTDTSKVSVSLNDNFDVVDIHIHAHNNTGLGQQFNWLLKSYSAPSVSWEVNLCDNQNCYNMIISPGPYQSLNVPAGDSMDFKFQFSPHCIVGTVRAEVVAFFGSDSAGTAVVMHFKADITGNCVSGINTVKKRSIVLYPNPVKNSFTVKGLENAGNLSFEVYDMKGKLVSSKVKDTSYDSIEISVEGLSAGMYVLRAFDENGNEVATSKLNKND